MILVDSIENAIDQNKLAWGVFISRQPFTEFSSQDFVEKGVTLWNKWSNS